MKSRNLSSIFTIAAIIVAILVVVVGMLVPLRAPQGAESQYFCDVSVLSPRLKIAISDMDNNQLYTVGGEFFHSYEDNLFMDDGNGNVVREMRDDYNFISQNDHFFFDSNGYMYRMNGNFKLLADSYSVYDVDDNHIADIQCSLGMNKIVMTDTDGNVIAQCNSNIVRYDYIVSIFDNCEIDDESVLIMFASCVSDARADSE